MDARIIKTKATIQNAAIDLLRVKPLSDITVTELCAMAGINRNTFYAHYDTPRGVVEEITKQLLLELDGVAKQNTQSLDICRAVCRYLDHRRNIFLALADSNTENAYEQIAIEQARTDAKQRAKDSQSQYHSEFIIGGCVFVLKRWLRYGTESPEEMGLLIHDQFVKSLHAEK